MGRIAYFDCFSGAAGDMIVGALLDAGASIEELRGDLAALRVAGFTIEAAKVRKQGFAATKFTVHLDPSVEKPHRHLKHVRAIFESSGLAEAVRRPALRIFERLAEAEARAHGSALESVHFHEVGAIDAIVDVAAAVLALQRLNVERVLCSPIPTGSGTVTCAHGVMPVPAPGTAELLRNVPIAPSDEEAELTTPTGAAILTTLAESYGPLPAITFSALGYGAGTREGQTRPNLLRVFIGDEPAGTESDEIVVLQANLDDVSPQIVAYAQERLFAAGALDVYCQPIYMKKMRPGQVLTVLCDASKVRELEDVLFAETTTFGIRRHTAQRSKLSRTHDIVKTRYGDIRMKVGRRGARVLTAAPEFEDCRAAALAHKTALREVFQEALRCWTKR
ncbi:MAG TPA: nickel pincer cofactor biosynthesis protein LarC [Phycisphaerae bacterium]